MIVSSALCSKGVWPLLLLLLLPHLLMSFHLSTKAQVNTHEFNINVDQFGDIVKNCPERCNPRHNTNGSCQCFNFTVSSQECGFPKYFIKALQSMHPDISSQVIIQELIDDMEEIGDALNTSVSFCSPDVNSKTVLVSPKRLQKELNSMKERLNSALSSGSNRRK